MNKVLDVFSDACKIISCLKFLNLSSNESLVPSYHSRAHLCILDLNVLF